MISICAINITGRNGILLNDDGIPLILYYNGNPEDLQDYLLHNPEFMTLVRSKVVNLHNYPTAWVSGYVYYENEDISDTSVSINYTAYDGYSMLTQYTLLYEVLRKLYYTRFKKRYDIDGTPNVEVLHTMSIKLIGASNSKFDAETLLNYIRSQFIEHGYDVVYINKMITTMSNIIYNKQQATQVINNNNNENNNENEQ